MAADSQGDEFAAMNRPRGMKGYECPICYSLYDREDHLAKSLRCGHTACMDCLKQLHSTNNRVRCPNCRKEHALVGSVEDFPTNYSLLDALDAVCVTCQKQLAVETIKNLCHGCFQVHSSAMKKQFQDTLETTQAKIAEFRELAKDGKKVKSISAMEAKLIAEIKLVFRKYRRDLNAKEKNMIEEIRKEAKSDVESVMTKQKKMEKTAGILQEKLDDFASSSAKLMPTDITKASLHLDQLETSSKEIRELTKMEERWPCTRINYQKIHDCTKLLKSFSLHHCNLCDDRNLHNQVQSVSDDSMWYGESRVKQCFDNESLGMEVFNKPHDLAISPVDSNVVVLNEGNRSLAFFERIDITGFRRDMEYQFQNLLENLGEENSQFVGVAMDQNDQIYISDCQGNCVWVFSSTGELLRKIGSQGNGPLQFNNPAGLAIDHKAGYLYICDSQNNRVQVVTLEGEYVHSFGPGRPSEEDNNDHGGPRYIVVKKGSTGKIYVVNSGCRVHVYSKNGTYLQLIDTATEAKYGLAMDKKGNFLTADSHPNVFLKSSEYDIYIQLGYRETDEKHSFDDVRGIAIDCHGRVLMCDYTRNNLKVLGTWYL